MAPPTGGERGRAGCVRGCGHPVRVDEGTLSEYAEAVLDVVDSVPPGRVTTYGRVAVLLSGAGFGGSARTVGAVMAAHGGAVAWWRVCPVSGAAPAHPAEAVRRWADEGTPLRRADRHDPTAVRVDMPAALCEVRLPGWVGTR